MLELFALSVVCGIASAIVANSKGRSVAGYFFLGFFLSIIGLLVAIGVPSLHPAGGRAAAPATSRDLVNCPRCKGLRQLGSFACPHCGDGPITAPAPTLKKCPACAELIQREAIKCRYCGTDVPPEEPKKVAVVAPMEPAKPEMGICPKCASPRLQFSPKCEKCGNTAHTIFR